MTHGAEGWYKTGSLGASCASPDGDAMGGGGQGGRWQEEGQIRIRNRRKHGKGGRGSRGNFCSSSSSTLGAAVAVAAILLSDKLFFAQGEARFVTHVISSTEQSTVIFFSFLQSVRPLWPLLPRLRVGGEARGRPVHGGLQEEVAAAPPEAEALGCALDNRLNNDNNSGSPFPRSLGPFQPVPVVLVRLRPSPRRHSAQRGQRGRLGEGGGAIRVRRADKEEDRLRALPSAAPGAAAEVEL